MRVRTWDTLSALNFVKLAQGFRPLREIFTKQSKFSRFLAKAYISIPIMLKVYLRERKTKESTNDTIGHDNIQRPITRLIIIIIISLIRQVGSNKRKIQIKYTIQNKQTTMKKTQSMQTYR